MCEPPSLTDVSMRAVEQLALVLAVMIMCSFLYLILCLVEKLIVHITPFFLHSRVITKTAPLSSKVYSDSQVRTKTPQPTIWWEATCAGLPDCLDRHNSNRSKPRRMPKPPLRTYRPRELKVSNLPLRRVGNRVGASKPDTQCPTPMLPTRILPR